MIRTRFAVAALAVALVTQGASAQLVTNGGFENGGDPPNGWSLTPGACYTSAYNSHPHTGTYALTSGPVSGTCTVSQSIATTPGAQYTFSFWLAQFEFDTPNSFDARWNGVSVYSLVDAPAFDYFKQTFAVVATGASTNIEFVIRHDSYYYYVDDVSVERMEAGPLSTVPEPSTYALLAAGLLGIVAVRRRRRIV